MIRSHKPRGFQWTCASPFQQTLEMRNLQYDDCIAPTSGLTVHYDDDNVSGSERTAKRRKIETLADEFLNGDVPFIQSARLQYQTLGHTNRFTTCKVEPEAYEDAGGGVEVEEPLWRDELSDREVLQRARCFQADSEALCKTVHPPTEPQRQMKMCSDCKKNGVHSGQALCRPRRQYQGLHVNSMPAPDSDTQFHLISGGARSRNDDHPRATSLRAADSESFDGDGDQLTETVTGQISRKQDRIDPHRHSAPHLKETRASPCSSSATAHAKACSTVRRSRSLSPHGEPSPEDHGDALPLESVCSAAAKGSNQAHDSGGNSTGDERHTTDHHASLSTPMGNQYLNTILPARSIPFQAPRSLRRTIRDEWRKSGAEISMAPNMPTSSQPKYNHEQQPAIEVVASHKSQPLSTDSHANNGPRAGSNTTESPTHTKTSVIAQRDSQSTASATNGLVSLSLQKDTSSRPLRRKPLQQLSPESLPGTQTLLHGWKGWSTVKDLRTDIGKDVRAWYSLSSEKNQPSFNSIEQLTRESSSASKVNSLIASNGAHLSTPSASAPASMYLSAEEVLENNPTNTGPHLSLGRSHRVDSQTLCTTTDESA